MPDKGKVGSNRDSSCDPSLNYGSIIPRPRHPQLSGAHKRVKGFNPFALALANESRERERATEGGRREEREKRDQRG